MLKKKFYILLFCDKTSNNIYNSHTCINELKKKFKNFLLLNYYYLNNDKSFEKTKKNKTSISIFEPKTFFELKNFQR